MNYGGNVLPIFTSFAELQREQAEAEQEYAIENARIFARLDAVKAVIDSDSEMLSKLADTDVTLAKAHVARHGDKAEFESLSEAVYALKAAVNRRNARIFGVGEAAKRTQRFASAQARRYTGPTSEVTSIEGKRNERS